jgi:hypothetical protein
MKLWEELLEAIGDMLEDAYNQEPNVAVVDREKLDRVECLYMECKDEK